jgi:hypothetical protein
VGFTFFSYHLPITIFGVVDASREKNYCYLTDKLQSGSKSGNVTLNYLLRYKHTNNINSFHVIFFSVSFVQVHLPWWVFNLVIYMDNAGD